MSMSLGQALTIIRMELESRKISGEELLAAMREHLQTPLCSESFLDLGLLSLIVVENKTVAAVTGGFHVLLRILEKREKENGIQLHSSDVVSPPRE